MTAVPSLPLFNIPALLRRGDRDILSAICDDRGSCGAIREFSLAMS